MRRTRCLAMRALGGARVWRATMAHGDRAAACVRADPHMHYIAQIVWCMLQQCVKKCVCMCVCCKHGKWKSFSIGTCGVVSALRAVVYAATLHVRAADEEHKEVMSDHVFLGQELRGSGGRSGRRTGRERERVRDLCAKLIHTCTYTHASMRNVHMQHGKCIVCLCHTRFRSFRA